MEIQKGLYGLPQAGKLANDLLKKRLAPHGYYEIPQAPGLWQHKNCPIQFTLVVDDFGVKYVGKEHAEHLIQTLANHYPIDVDWNGALYCGVTLDWDYIRRHLDISMPKYVPQK